MMKKIIYAGTLIVSIFILFSSCAHSPWMEKINLARKAEAEGNRESAIEQLNEIIALNPEEKIVPLVMLEKARIYFEMHSYKKAREELEMLFLRYPSYEDNFNALYYYSLTLYFQNEFNEAIEYLAKLFSIKIKDKQQVQFLKDAKKFYALSLMNAGRYMECSAEFQKMMEEAKNLKERIEYAFNKGICLEKNGYLKEAYEAFLIADEIKEKSELKPEIKYHLSHIAFVMGNFELALDHLHSIEFLSDYNYSFTNAYSLIKDILSPIEDISTLDMVSRKYQGSYIGYVSSLKAIDIAIKNQDYQEAYEKCGMLVSTYQNKNFYDEEKINNLLLETSTKKDTRPDRIGCIAPLTGRVSIYGQKMVRGVKLAVKEFNEATQDNKIELVVLDSSGKKDAGSLVEELVIKHKVIGIVGPLLSKEMENAAEKINAYQIVCINPGAISEDIHKLSPYIFRNSLTNYQQVYYLVSFVFDVPQLTKYAILYPDNQYGKSFKDLFTEVIVDKGGEVLAAISYKPDEVDFKSAILGLKNYKFEVLVLPDIAERIAQLIPQILFWGIEDKLFIGCDGWNSPRLLEIGEKYIDGSIFVDGFFLESNNPATKEFVIRYRAAYAEEPDRFAATGYDAAKLLLYAISRGCKSRECIRNELLSVENFPGASGITTITPNGDSIKEPFLLGVYEGKIVQLN